MPFGFFAPLAAVGALASGCGEETVPCKVATGPAGTAQTTGATGASGTSTTGSGGAQGGAGAGGGEQGGGNAGGNVAPADNACIGDFAFRAAGASFAPPTPKALALALTQFSFDSATEHPITIVLRSTDPAKATVAASPTSLVDFQEEFVPGLEPEFTAATIMAGRFISAAPQNMGYVRVTHETGNLDLRVGNVTIDAATASDCGQAMVSIVAIVPAAERTKTLVVSGKTTTVGALAGGSAANDFDVAMLFLAETVSFNFSNL
ncbi:MAG: hypothetical protein EXR75_06760 [Myxococcales bacterium]|nr:hypothetical protein [Myxococcales bacterium]